LRQKEADFAKNKEKSEPFGSDFMVDDTRLELENADSQILSEGAKKYHLSTLSRFSFYQLSTAFINQNQVICRKKSRNSRRASRPFTVS